MIGRLSRLTKCANIGTLGSSINYTNICLIIIACKSSPLLFNLLCYNQVFPDLPSWRVRVEVRVQEADQADLPLQATEAGRRLLEGQRRQTRLQRRVQRSQTEGSLMNTQFT